VALYANTSGANNVAIGQQALRFNTTASNNTAVGYQAGYSNTTGTEITAVGYQALYTSTGNYNSAFGFKALTSNTTGTENTAIGDAVLQFNTTGGYNTAVGAVAMNANTTGEQNVAVGRESARRNTTGNYNTAIGFQSFSNNTTGSNSTALGYYALGVATTGTVNTAVGYASGSAITTGSKNVILGSYTGNSGGLDIRTASNYIVLSDGDGNPRGIFDGSGNFLVGTTSAYASGATPHLFVSANTSGKYVAVFKNANATPGCLILDLSADPNNTSDTYIATGQNRFKVLSNGNVQNTNNSYGAISDVKLKENIVDASPKLADLMQVKVRNYNLIGETTRQIGVVAQELETVFPSMVDESFDRDAEGNDLGTTTKSVKYSVFVPMLIKAMQEQQAIIESLKARLDAANL
jgi:hypothetical protein